MNNPYRKTLFAGYMTYVAQAIGVNLAPLLFSAFALNYGINLIELTSLISLNFILQIIIDASGDPLIKKLGFRKLAIIANGLCAISLIMLATLHFVINPYIAILISTVILALGTGLTEVSVSPMIDALPLDNKSSQMCLLHSFYSWGHLAVVGISTIALSFMNGKWYILPIIWATIPVCNVISFLKVPIVDVNEDSPSYKGVLKSKSFIFIIIMMICAGALEQSVAQWASYYTEIALNLNKTTGDLLGVCGFALLMAIARTFYGLSGEKINLAKFIAFSSLSCVIGLLLIIFTPSPVFALVGIALCGLGVGILWPGILAISSKLNPEGSSAMFSLLALGGDIGCTLGPSVVGIISNASSLETGFSGACAFAVLLLVTTLTVYGKNKQKLQK